MKIALCSSFVPFVKGGYRNIVDWLQLTLQEAGHHVEKIYLPEKYVPECLFQQMMAFRWIDLQKADRVICFRPQSHMIPHRHKIIWFIHHLRVFYDLWETKFRWFPDDLQHRGIRDGLHFVDDQALRESKSVFTNSQVISDRLKHYHHLESEVLYPPIYQPERFYHFGFNEEIVYFSRLESHKRQHLILKAMQYTKTPVHLRICGVGTSYAQELMLQVTSLKLQDRVTLENRWISEEEKVEILAHCLALAYLPWDEDSYGYPSLEASLASKPILTTQDSGGVLELVKNGVNGYITEPNAEELAEAMDRLYLDRSKTIAMGKRAFERLKELKISWEHVMDRLLS